MVNGQSILVETAWQLRGPAGRVLLCTIHTAQKGFVVQIGQSPREITRTCIVGNLKRARRKAEEWRSTLLSLSEFGELEGYRTIS